MPRLKLSLCLIFLLVACNAVEPEIVELPSTVEMIFIYDEACATCIGAREFHEMVAEQLGDEYPFSVRTINIFHSGAMDNFMNISYNLLGMDASEIQLPALIMGGQVYQGMDAIQTNLLEAYLTTGHDLFVNGFVFNPRYQRTGTELFYDYQIEPSHINLVYLYRVVCPACIEIEPLLATLPESVETIPLELVRINTRSGNNREKVIALFDKFQVPDERRMVPILFTVNDHFTGPDEIRDFIYYKTFADSGLIGFQFP